MASKKKIIKTAGKKKVLKKSFSTKKKIKKAAKKLKTVSAPAKKTTKRAEAKSPKLDKAVKKASTVSKTSTRDLDKLCTIISLELLSAALSPTGITTSMVEAILIAHEDDIMNAAGGTKPAIKGKKYSLKGTSNVFTSVSAAKDAKTSISDMDSIQTSIGSSASYTKTNISRSV